MAISVLYIHHCGAFGGASRSIYELISGFPPMMVNPHIISQKGSSSTFFKKSNIPTIETIGLSQFDNTRYSYYRGFRWFILLRELAYVPSTFLSLVRAKIKWPKIDLIHINEITNLPVVIFCLLLFKKPIVIHARSVQRNDPNSFRSKLINKILQNKRIKIIIAIDQTVNKSISSKLKTTVVHNSFTGGKSNLNDTFNKDPSNLLVVGFVGNLLKVKGIYELIDAAKRCKENDLNVKFRIIGYIPTSKRSLIKFILKKTGIIQDSTNEILQLIEIFKLNEIIDLEPFSSDISYLYSTFDVLCFPSHLNAIGRPVIEAAFSRIPSIVAITDPSGDTFIDGKTGIAFDRFDRISLFNAINYFFINPSEIKRMGQNAYELAEKNFDPRKNAIRVIEVYNSILTQKMNIS